MFRTLSLAALACAGISTALACGSQDAKPTSEKSELRLLERSAEPRVVYTAGKFEIHISPQDLLAVMKGHGPIPFDDDAFAARLRSRMPLQADISIHDILAELAPEAPAPGEKTVRRVDYSRFWRQSDERLRYTAARLLETGRAAVVEKSSGAALNTVTRNAYNDICYAGRKFLAPDGTVILEVIDQIA